MSHLQDEARAANGRAGAKKQRGRKRPQVTTHGHSKPPSPTYRTWDSMRARCKYPSVNGYEIYGGRGIAVCERWRQFENFLADMGERPEGMTLDRVDGDGDYEPDNCRWATPSEQASHRVRHKPMSSEERATRQKAGRINGTASCAQRWRCHTCGREMSPGNLGRHQKAQGHEGRTLVSANAGMQ